MLLLRVIEHRQEPALADAATEDLGAAFDALDGALAHRRLVGRVARALAVVEVARRRRQLAVPVDGECPFGLAPRGGAGAQEVGRVRVAQV